MEWVWRLAARSNDQAVANARAASTLLSRHRVERDEVDLYLQQRYAATSATVQPVAQSVGRSVGRVVGDARTSGVAR